MLTAYIATEKGLEKSAPGGDALPAAAVWIDLISPTLEEERLVEQSLGIEVPTREEMQEIEVSSRLYREGETTYCTLGMLANADSAQPEGIDVTFILTRGALVTLRYADPLPFRLFRDRLSKHPEICTSNDMVFVHIVDTIVDRLADILEKVEQDLETLSRMVFGRDEARQNRKRARRTGKDLRAVLRGIGRAGDLTSKVRESLVGLNRMIAFYSQIADERIKRDLKARLKSLVRDAHSLSDHASFLNGKITFMLDATLGMISIQQNDTIKIFSVVAVVFLPPTLIASIYGMNFHFMPELDWPFGYPVAVVLMILSAVLPYLYFKRRGWM